MNVNKSYEDVKHIKALLDDGLANDVDEAALSDILGNMHGMAEDAVVALLYSIDDDEMLVGAMKSTILSYQDRKNASERRISNKRMLIAQFLKILEIEKIKTPAGTVSVGQSPLKLDIEDEALLPAEFIVIEEQEPKVTINKKAILAAIESGREIDGAKSFREDAILKVRKK